MQVCHNGLPQLQEKKQDTSPFPQRSTNFLTARLCFRNETNGKPLWQWLSKKLNYSSTNRGKPL